MSDSEQPNLGGRPRVYSDPEVFAARVQAYFDSLEENNKRPTFAGISFFLGFEDRESFANYANLDGFSRTVKQARLLIEDDRWQSLIDKNAFTPGLIFDLKNNHGWKDKSETELTGANGGPVETVNWTANADEETLKKVAALKGL